MCVSSLFTSDRRRASEAGDALGQALQNAYVAQAHYVGIFNSTFLSLLQWSISS